MDGWTPSLLWRRISCALARRECRKGRKGSLNIARNSFPSSLKPARNISLSRKKKCAKNLPTFCEKCAKTSSIGGLTGCVQVSTVLPAMAQLLEPIHTVVRNVSLLYHSSKYQPFVSAGRCLLSPISVDYFVCLPIAAHPGIAAGFRLPPLPRTL